MHLCCKAGAESFVGIVVHSPVRQPRSGKGSRPRQRPKNLCSCNLKVHGDDAARVSGRQSKSRDLSQQRPRLVVVQVPLRKIDRVARERELKEMSIVSAWKTSCC